MILYHNFYKFFIRLYFKYFHMNAFKENNTYFVENMRIKNYNLTNTKLYSDLLSSQEYRKL